jgi:hypothetical protein
MPWTTKLLVIANRTIESEDPRCDCPPRGDGSGAGHACRTRVQRRRFDSRAPRGDGANA